MRDVLDDHDAPWNPIVEAGLLEPTQVHEAAGMVMVQLGVRPKDAIARLRGRAALLDQPLPEVADAVVARQLRFSS